MARKGPAVAKEEDKLADAKRQGQAQYDSISEMVRDLRGWEAAAKDAGWEEYQDKFGVLCWKHADGATWAGTAAELCEEHGIEPTSDMEEEGRRRIEEDALSVQVRSGWYSPGDTEASKPEEYEILLCTGGPACRIIGDLSEHSEPSTAQMQVQDWFQPWTDFYPKGEDTEETLLAYARVFYFGD